eukprot:50187_1
MLSTFSPTVFYKLRQGMNELKNEIKLFTKAAEPSQLSMMLVCIWWLLFLLNVSQAKKCEHDELLVEALKNDISGEVQQRLDLLEEKYKITKKILESRRRRNLLDDSSTSQYFDGILEIPVILHIIYSNTQQVSSGETLNDIINNQRITSQLWRLNKDFLMLNPEINTIPSLEGWDKLVANYSMTFKLSQVRRIETSNSGVGGADLVFSSKGGDDVIDARHYLNAYVSWSTGGGFAWLPGSTVYDAVVAGYKYFGDNTWDYNNNWYIDGSWYLGRTYTHEVGHYMFLEHIWGITGGGTEICDDTDHVEDTPNQNGWHSGCPEYNTSEARSCGSNDIFMNYMDYVDDYCYSMFTEGQLLRSMSLFDPYFGARRWLVDYQRYGDMDKRFVNHIYFRVLQANDDTTLNDACAALDTLINLDLSDDDDTSYIFACFSTTNNYFVDGIIDIILCQQANDEYDYFLNVNLQNDDTSTNAVNLCYTRSQTVFDDGTHSLISDITFFKVSELINDEIYNGYNILYIKSTGSFYIYLGYKMDDFFVPSPHSMTPTYKSISCDETVVDTYSYPGLDDYHIYKFEADKRYDLVYLEACLSQVDTWLYLFDKDLQLIYSADNEFEHGDQTNCNNKLGAGDITISSTTSKPNPIDVLFGDVYYFGVGTYGNTVGEYTITLKCNASKDYVLVNVDEGLTQSEANNYCLDKFGTTLATIQSKDDYNSARGIIDDSNVGVASEDPWIGLVNENKGENIPPWFVWESGDICNKPWLSYGGCVLKTFWMNNKPINCDEGGADCTIFYNDGFNNDQQCDSTRFTFLCNYGLYTNINIETNNDAHSINHIHDINIPDLIMNHNKNENENYNFYQILTTYFNSYWIYVA